MKLVDRVRAEQDAPRFPSLISEGSIEAARRRQRPQWSRLFPSLISEGSIEAWADRERRTWRTVFPSLISEGSIEATRGCGTAGRSARFPR